MYKRLISLALVMLLALAALPAAALIGGEGGTRHAYVYTSNGKNLNLRAGPGTDYGVVGSIPYGASVHLNDYIDQSWVSVDYNGLSGYVMGRYLRYDQPQPKPQPTPKPDPRPTAKPDPSAPTSMKEVFKGFEFISYTVQVRPSTPGGFVHMRWAPTKAAEPIRDYHQYDVLTVIAQNHTWAQVVDPSTGVTGFMMRSFLTDFGVGGASNDAGGS